MPEPTPSALELGQAAAARLGAAEWLLDAEPPPDDGPTDSEVRLAAAPPPALPPYTFRPTPPEAPPPTPDQIVEAMLFAGGAPLTAETAGAAIRGFPPEAFREAVDRLAKKYRRQRRPYAVRPRADGFVLELRPEFRAVKERLFGGPREARLTQPALDVLSLVAYRQPIAKSELDALRGMDCGTILRQLVRLGLVAATPRRDGTGGAAYGTTPRFLELFGLRSPDELPRCEEI